MHGHARACTGAHLQPWVAHGGGFGSWICKRMCYPEGSISPHHGQLGFSRWAVACPCAVPYALPHGAAPHGPALERSTSRYGCRGFLPCCATAETAVGPGPLATLRPPPPPPPSPHRWCGTGACDRHPYSVMRCCVAAVCSTPKPMVPRHDAIRRGGGLVTPECIQRWLMCCAGAANDD